ncbi:MAG: transpeptidase family protein [Candidatus Riflebacteria bacterium]|nr:transpeptidase family protein [Candidatus Riflebacteria bacterium]
MNLNRLRPRTMRVLYLFLTIGVVLSLFFLRLAYLQIIQYEFWSQLSEKNHLTRHTIDVKRGSIFDRNGVDLAISVETYTMYLYTKEVKSIRETANILSTIIPLTREEILAKIAGRKGYLPIMKGIERPIATKVMALNLPGVIFEENYRRIYPQNSLASNILGFCGADGQGLEGLERSFHDTMRGYPGVSVQEDVSFGEEGSSGLRVVKPPAGGCNLTLTIDSFIQHIMETELAKLIEQYKPIDATAIAMDPYTGEILGMACLPNYDLNKFAESPSDSYRNRPVVDVFEPGSCMKIFAAACGIKTGKITSGTRFYCKGFGEVMGRHIKCHGSHGLVDINEAIAQSCNSSMVQISQLIDSRQLYRMYREMGFGEPTGIETPSESQGMFSSPSKWSGLSAASLCIGQELAVTGIQLVRAYSAVANGGLLMKPHLIKSIVSQTGDIREEIHPEPIRRVFPEKLAESLRKMLIGVVDHGTGQQAAIADYSVGGKTSTAQKANPHGGYFQEKVNTSFIGMLPAMNPRIVLFVAANEPKGEEKTLFGGKVAGPVFAIIGDRILKYLKVQPDKHPAIATSSASVDKASNDTVAATSTLLHGMDLNSFAPPLAEQCPIASNASSSLQDSIPNFMGLTLKEVASMARTLDLPVRLVGNGIAVEQSPQAGAPRSAANPLTIKFSPRIGE